MNHPQPIRGTAQASSKAIGEGDGKVEIQRLTLSQLPRIELYLTRTAVRRCRLFITQKRF